MQDSIASIGRAGHHNASVLGGSSRLRGAAMPFAEWLGLPPRRACSVGLRFSSAPDMARAARDNSTYN